MARMISSSDHVPKPVSGSGVIFGAMAMPNSLVGGHLAKKTASFPFRSDMRCQKTAEMLKALGFFSFSLHQEPGHWPNILAEMVFQTPQALGIPSDSRRCRGDFLGWRRALELIGKL